MKVVLFHMKKYQYNRCRQAMFFSPLSDHQPADLVKQKTRVRAINFTEKLPSKAENNSWHTFLISLEEIPVHLSF